MHIYLNFDRIIFSNFKKSIHQVQLFKMEYKYITRSHMKSIEELEKLNSSISIDLVWSKKNKKRMETIKKLQKLMYDYNICRKTEEKLEKNRIIWNHLIYDKNFHFILQSKKMREVFIKKMKLFSKHDKNFYLYIPYFYDILESMNK